MAQEADPARGDFGPPVQSGQRFAPLVPGPPTAPLNPSRPTSWPGGAAAAGPTEPDVGQPRSPAAQPAKQGRQLSPTEIPPQPGSNPAPGAGDGELAPCEGAEILARVGPEVILACEVNGAVNEFLVRRQAEIPPSELDAVRMRLVQQQLKHAIDTKLVFLDAKRDIPNEALPKLEARIGEIFEKTELEKLMKRAKVETRTELDQKYRLLGTSLEREKRSFIERTLAQEWIRQKVKFEGEIGPDEMVSYYQSHLADFEHPAQARWEELMVRLAKHSSREAAFRAIAEMGNQVLAGKPFADVARNLSDGTTAKDGGVREWTTEGSLVAGELDRAIFGLPVGQLSQIIETKYGLHIVRVLEKKAAGRTPFVEAQVTIREKIKEQKTRDQLQAYLGKLEKRVPISTIFDDLKDTPQTGSRPAETSIR